MTRSSYTFTSESVSEGHPDKVCDRISDSILDLYLSKDPVARVACETLATTDRIVLAGEVRSSADISDDDINNTVRAAIREIGYEQNHFHWQTVEITNLLHEQSVDIAQGVDEGSGTYAEEGAGDQGIMFGFATDETPELMPAPLYYAQAILQELARMRKSGEEPRLQPDAKSQVSLKYEHGKPVGATCVVVSTQHTDGTSLEEVRNIVAPVVKRILPDGWMPPEDEFYINPTGKFVIGGPDGDAGLTGRKIIVDTYGGAAPHGGGAFSGKDPTKVDRSAAYATRHLAKNVVAAGLAKKCLIQVSYAIGVAKPLSIFVDTFGTATVDEEKIEAALRTVDMTPKGIRTRLALNNPIYARTAAYGHFGRTPDAEGGFSWEQTDLVDQLKAAV